MPTRPALHRHQLYKPREQVRRDYDKQHNATKAKVYDAEWRRLRLRHLHDNPLCVMCKYEGKIVEATVVDHIVPISKAQDRRLDPTNLQSLCAHHHNQKTYAETWGSR